MKSGDIWGTSGIGLDVLEAEVIQPPAGAPDAPPVLNVLAVITQPTGDGRGGLFSKKRTRVVTLSPGKLLSRSSARCSAASRRPTAARRSRISGPSGSKTMPLTRAGALSGPCCSVPRSSLHPLVCPPHPPLGAQIYDSIC